MVEALKPPKPDVVIYLDIPVERAMERKKHKDRYESNARLLEAVSRIYRELAKTNFYAERWVRIDATKGAEEIFEEVKRVISYL